MGIIKISRIKGDSKIAEKSRIGVPKCVLVMCLAGELVLNAGYSFPDYAVLAVSMDAMLL